MLRALTRPTTLAVGTFGLIALRVIRLFVDIKIAWISTDRIGHFVPDVCMSRADLISGEIGQRTYFCVDPKELVSNQFWYKVFERNLPVRRWLWPIVWSSQILPHPPAWVVSPPRRTRGSRNIKGVLDPPQFSERENEDAKEWLRAKGWKDGEPFVCLMVRDRAYLASWLESSEGIFGGSVDYHSYRDCSIDTYSQAADWLSDQGCWVFRMGQSALEPLQSSNPKVVDYAFDPERSDFLDVWLFANCYICVTAGTGPCEISNHYGRPILNLNMIPLGATQTWSHCITAVKPLYWKNGERLSLKEHIDALYFRTEDYYHAEIEIRDLTSDQILRVIKEMWMRTKGEWSPSKMEVRRNAEFFELLQNSRAAELHGFRNPLAGLSYEWLSDLEEDRLDKDVD